MFAVANSALINMLMASRLIYGMSREHVLPAVLGKVHPTRRTPYIAIGFTTLLAFALITFVGEVPALGGTTALLLLVRVHGGQHRGAGAAQGHGRATSTSARRRSCRCSARSPAHSSSGPWTGRDPQQYLIAGVLIAIGVALWVVTVLVNRATGVKPAEPLMEDIGGDGPQN